jgi:hypothetical protein
MLGVPQTAASVRPHDTPLQEMPKSWPGVFWLRRCETTAVGRDWHGDLEAEEEGQPTQDLFCIVITG